MESSDKIVGKACTDGVMGLSSGATGSNWTGASESSLKKVVTGLVITCWNLGYLSDILGPLEGVSWEISVLGD